MQIHIIVRKDGTLAACDVFTNWQRAASLADELNRNGRGELMEPREYNVASRLVADSKSTPIINNERDPGTAGWKTPA